MAYADDVGNVKQRAACAKNYAEDPARHKQRVRDREKIALAYIRSQKTKCARCPETFHRCLDFHHLRDKAFNLGTAARQGFSLAKIRAEIEKCILLCANCHRKETFKQEFNDRLVKLEIT